jgi:hypothetical protein
VTEVREVRDVREIREEISEFGRWKYSPQPRAPSSVPLSHPSWRAGARAGTCVNSSVCELVLLGKL